MIKLFRVVVAVCLATGLVVFSELSQVAAQGSLRLGGPLRGLSAVEFEEFLLGLDDFLEVENAEEGPVSYTHLTLPTKA